MHQVSHANGAEVRIISTTEAWGFNIIYLSCEYCFRIKISCIWKHIQVFHLLITCGIQMVIHQCRNFHYSVMAYYIDSQHLIFCDTEMSILSLFYHCRLHEPSVLQRISHHHESGLPLSGSSIKELLASQNHMAGYDLCSELYLAHLDMELHTRSYFCSWLKLINCLL